MRPLSRLFLAAFALASAAARAGEFAPAPPAPGMALTLPDPGMANSTPATPPGLGAPPVAVQADLTGGRRRLRALGSGFPSTDGQLPNQRTGPRRERVVHDICIGC
ncbi:hypothetical protein JOE48_000622 [Methylobacterium sp. PvR107]|nr:hypothetical protein [Methylobacterium sp. PvR107]